MRFPFKVLVKGESIFHGFTDEIVMRINDDGFFVILLAITAKGNRNKDSEE
jgi:hypothetical protein